MAKQTKSAVLSPLDSAKKEEIFTAYKRFIEIYSKGSSRYESFDFIYDKFAACYEKYMKTGMGNAEPSDEENDELALYLFVYLASWGMIRGSSFLLFKNYRVLIPAIEVLFKKEYECLYHIVPCKDEERKSNYINKMQDIGSDLRTELTKENSYYKLDKEVAISVPSLTLLSKILMGTLGCIPAIDRFDRTTLKEMCDMLTFDYNDRTLGLIWDIAAENIDYLNKAQEDIKTNTTDPDGNHPNRQNREYSLFKVLDMCLWQYGGEHDPKGKTVEE